jgi:hypothetical protein
MLLPLGTTAIVIAALLWELALPRLRESLPELASSLLRRRWVRHGGEHLDYDPGRELRAEQRARELLRSCVNEEEWAMYRDLGFLRVLGPHPSTPAGAPRYNATLGAVEEERSRAETAADGCSGYGAGAPYAYLLYPHRPIVAYVPRTGALLNEYCVAFPDHTRPYGSARLPDADDVLAKWMALSADERRLIADANMHLPGRQVDPQQVREDLARLARWERERGERPIRAPGGVAAT